MITVEPEETRQARPPRALCPDKFIVGHSLGKPNDPRFQKAIIQDALDLLVHAPPPGTVVIKTYS